MQSVYNIRPIATGITNNSDSSKNLIRDKESADGSFASVRAPFTDPVKSRQDDKILVRLTSVEPLSASSDSKSPLLLNK